jgi:hypothetical protein
MLAQCTPACRSPSVVSRAALLGPGADLTWLTDTTSILSVAETYLLITRTTGWDLDTYERWLNRTLSRLIASPAR